MSKILCLNCCCWSPILDGIAGECRRRNPAKTNDQDAATWPTTRQSDWCSEALIKQPDEN